MTERGEPPLWLVALGLVLAAVTVTLPWTARAVADREPGQVNRAVAVPQVAASQISETPAAEPYVVAPDVDIAPRRRGLGRLPAYRCGSWSPLCTSTLP